MDFEMGEREDFGDWGDERMLGSCQADWLDEVYSNADRFDFWKERQREREIEEVKLEFADEANDERGHEPEGYDFVREQRDGNDDPFRDDDDYLDCD
jgi:hypothetical protein